MSFDTFAMLTEGLISSASAGGVPQPVGELLAVVDDAPSAVVAPDRDLSITIANRTLISRQDNNQPIFVFFKEPG